MSSAAGEADLSDEALMRALASGDADAIGPIYARYAPTILGMAAQAVGRATGEEILQDVFLAVWKNAPSFDPKRGAVRPWLLQIAHYRIANELRRRSRRPETHEDPQAAPLATAPDPSPDQSVEAWHAFRRSVLRRALDELPDAQRQALGLAFFDELSHEEIARVLRLPLGTAKSRIRAGLAGLRVRLAPLLAVLVIGAALAWLGVQTAIRRRDLARDERALAMLTASDSEAIRLSASSGVPDATHATYRRRPRTPIGVLTLSNFPAARAGRTYQAWVLRTGRWISLGTVRSDAAGKARLIAEAPELAFRPEAVEVTLEPAGGSPAPTGPKVVSWTAQ